MQLFPVSLETDDGNRGSNGFKWSDSVEGADGCVYGIPFDSPRVLRFNPVDESTVEIGPKHVNLGGRKWKTGVLAGNGCIYCIPRNTNIDMILKIDTLMGEVTIIKNVKFPEVGIMLWESGALASDGCIYYMPKVASFILKLDPRDDTVTAVGTCFGREVFKYSGTVAADDGHIYGIPNKANCIVKFHPVTQVTTVMKEPNGKRFLCCSGGVLSRDKKYIYCFKRRNAEVLRIDLIQGTFSFVGDKSFYISDFYFSIGNRPLRGNDGCIYWTIFIDDDYTSIVQFDPGLETLSLHRMDENCNKTVAIWKGGTEGSDGAIYFLPWSGSQILCIDPFEEFLIQIKARIKQFPAELGRLFVADDDGKTAFDSAIAKFGEEKVYRVLVDSIPLTVNISCEELPSTVLAASSDNTSVSLVYLLLRKNINCLPSIIHSGRYLL